MTLLFRYGIDVAMDSYSIGVHDVALFREPGERLEKKKENLEFLVKNFSFVFPYRLKSEQHFGEWLKLLPTEIFADFFHC